MAFRALPGANLGAGITEETNSLGDLFEPGYVFGVPILPIENAPGEAAPQIDVPRGEPAQVYGPPDDEPSPIASTVQTGADSKWVPWPGANSSVVVALPDGSDIRSLWIPVVPTIIAITLGYASGAMMYELTTAGGEVVPIPKGTKLLTLSALSTVAKSDLWVFATADVWAPNKTGLNGPPLPISGAISPYDAMVLATPNLEFYWPLSDQIGSLFAKDYGPFKVNASPGGGVQFGSSPLITDNTTSAQFDGALNTNLSTNTAAPGNGVSGPFSVEFWFAFTGFNSAGLNGNTRASLFSNTGAGAVNVAIDTTDNDLVVDNGQGGFQNLATLVVGTSYYFALTYDGTNWKAYVNGNLVYTTTNALVSLPMTAPCHLDQSSSSTNGAGAFFEKLAFYGAALTPAQIAQRYTYHP